MALSLALSLSLSHTHTIHAHKNLLDISKQLAFVEGARKARWFTTSQLYILIIEIHYLIVDEAIHFWLAFLTHFPFQMNKSEYEETAL